MLAIVVVADRLVGQRVFLVKLADAGVMALLIEFSRFRIRRRNDINRTQRDGLAIFNVADVIRNRSAS
ncbi:hypothetical protein D3C73_1598020 [compost metagenome]